MRTAGVAATTLALCAVVSARGVTNELSGPAATLFTKATAGRQYAKAEHLHPQILPMSNAPAFLVVWRSSTNAPAKWIVSLHGQEGFATDDLAIWSPHLKGRDVGLVCVQWWLGTGNSTADYLRPEQVHREIDLALQRLGAKPGAVMFHGFSRGSANSYPIVALDASRGRHYFALNVASSGGVGVDYPPVRAITAGQFGDHPLKGTHWITSAGGRDQNPDRDGIPGMQRAADWLKQQGATVLFQIEDPDSGHGALVLNPKNAARVLDEFLGPAQ